MKLANNTYNVTTRYKILIKFVYYDVGIHVFEHTIIGYII